MRSQEDLAMAVGIDYPATLGWIIYAVDNVQWNVIMLEI